MKAHRHRSGLIEQLRLVRDIEITQSALVEAAEFHSPEVMELLLARNRDIEITERILVTTAENQSSVVMERLLARDPNIKIAETLLLVAMRNWQHGKELMKLLL